MRSLTGVGEFMSQFNFSGRTFERAQPDQNQHLGDTLENLIAAERPKIASDQQAANLHRNAEVKKRRAANRNIVKNLEKTNDL